MERIELFNDHFQNWKRYLNCKAQLIVADPPYCYDEETEVFTREGWKNYRELNYDDELLSLNHENLEMCYSGIDDIIIRDNDEDMYHFQSNNIDLFVSAKHRCFAVNQYKPNLKKGYRQRDRKRIHTENITLAKYISAAAYIPRDGYNWQDSKECEYIHIPSCQINTNGKEHIEQEISIPVSDWLPFFGLWLSDGCTCNSKESNGRQLYTISIKQFGERRSKVREILNHLPFKWHEYKEKDRDASNFNIHSKQLWLYLSQYGKSKDKYIPRWILDLNADYLKLFWDSYTFGDSTKSGSGLRISSVSKALIEGLQEIALKLGVICQIRSVTNKKWKDTKLYYFQFNDKSKNIKYANKKVIKDYIGKLWCVTLKKNSVFLVRRNGIITFSGNCIGKNAYASNPAWYVDGDNKNGESQLAGKEFFDTDKNFKPAEFMHFCSQMLAKEPKTGLSEEEIESGEYGNIKDEKVGGKQKSQAPCMILFCAFEQLHYYIDLAQQYGLKRYIPLVFRKNFSAQVLKANMKIVGNCEYGLVLYRDRLPKFNNDGRMIFNCFDWPRDTRTPKVHPTQKPIPLLEQLIRIFTDENDIVIDPCAGSGTTLIAAANLNRRAYGFEIKKDFYKKANELIKTQIQLQLF